MPSPPRPLFVGCFTFRTPGLPDAGADGSFLLLVEARSPSVAVARYRRRLRTLHAKHDLFGDGTEIYCEGVVEVASGLRRCVAVNFYSPVASAPGASVSCLVPGQGRSSVVGWVVGETESGVVEPFVVLGRLSGRAPPSRT